MRPDDLAVAAVQALLRQTGIGVEAVEDLILGCAFPEGEQGSTWRGWLCCWLGCLRAWAVSPVNRFCGSDAGYPPGCRGYSDGCRRGVHLCGRGIDDPHTHDRFQPDAESQAGRTAAGRLYEHGRDRGEYRTRVSDPRSEQEQFALSSQQRAARRGPGAVADEIVAVAEVQVDGCIREETTLAALAELQPAFDENGSVTAGTASPLTDGAAAVLVCSDAFRQKQRTGNTGKRSAVLPFRVVPGGDGHWPGYLQPQGVAARRPAGERCGYHRAQRSVCSSQSLACIRELGLICRRSISTAVP